MAAKVGNGMAKQSLGVRRFERRRMCAERYGGMSRVGKEGGAVTPVYICFILN